jgi:uncharacterized membrane protein YkvA (DUF1232 family)
MNSQPSLFPRPSPDSLAPEIERVFRPLCVPLAAPEATGLQATIAEHLHAVRQARQRNEFLDLAAAEAIAAGLQVLLEAYPGCPPAHQALIVGAVRYFAHSDDAEGDLISVLGFDDDAVVFNYVAGAVGRPELKVAL